MAVLVPNFVAASFGGSPNATLSDAASTRATSGLVRLLR